MSRGVLQRYAAERDLPALVNIALANSRAAGLDQACLPAVGRLLMALAAIPEGARLAELGTAGGIGAAWLASGLRPGGRLITFECDRERAAVASRVLAGAEAVELVVGDAADAAGRGPFDLVFADGGPKHEADAPERIAAMLRLGGIVVMDDFTPGRSAANDPTRAAWFGSARFRCSELGVAPDAAVLLGVRVR